MKLQQMDRDNLMLAITKAQVKLDQRRSSLSATQQASVRLDLQLQEASDKLENLTRHIDAVKMANAQPKTEILQHVATPIAKTVFRP